MRQNGYFNALASSRLVLDYVDWREGDLIEYDEHFLSFFRADGACSHKRELLQALVRYWQDPHGEADRSRLQQGLFIIDVDAAHPLLSVVGPNKKVVAAQFDCAKQIFYWLGLCRTYSPCIFGFDIDHELAARRKDTPPVAARSKWASLLGLKPSVVHLATQEPHVALVQEVRSAPAYQMSPGAVRSFLLLQGIAKAAGVPDLIELKTLSMQRDGYERHSRGANRPLAPRLLELSREKLDVAISHEAALIEALLQALTQGREQVNKQQQQGAPHDAKEDLWFMDQALETAADFSDLALNAERFDEMRVLGALARNVRSIPWLQYAGDLCLHTLMLLHCLQKNREEQEVALDMMEANLEQA